MFNQANLHATSVGNVDGPCEIMAMARYDKTGWFCKYMHAVGINECDVDL